MAVVEGAAAASLLAQMEALLHGTCGSGARVPVQILDLRSDQRSNLSGLSRVAPPVLLGIEVIDFCFYGKTGDATCCHF